MSRASWFNLTRRRADENDLDTIVFDKVEDDAPLSGVDVLASLVPAGELIRIVRHRATRTRRATP